MLELYCKFIDTPYNVSVTLLPRYAILQYCYNTITILYIKDALLKLTLEVDNLRIFGDSVSNNPGIGIRGIWLVVVAPENIVERIVAEAGEPDLSAVLHVVLLVDVVPGHAVSDNSFRYRDIRERRPSVSMRDADIKMLRTSPQVDSILPRAPVRTATLKRENERINLHSA